jgi:iron complex outermembrane receptor protein
LRRTIGFALFFLAGSCRIADAQEFETVTVTATRLPADGFSAPAAVDTVDGRTLRDGQMQVNLSEVLARVPGVFVQSRQNFAQDLQISSRGFGGRASFGVRGIKVLVDGIPAGGPDGQAQVASFSLGSAERVEVLRGPYSALYGNASGGVIQLITRRAPDTRQMEAGLAGASAGSNRLSANIGGPLGEHAGATLDVSHFATDGTRPHSAATRDLVSGRLDIRSQHASFMLTAHYLDIPAAQDALGLSRAQLATNPDQTASQATLFNTRKSTRQSQLGGVADWRMTADTQMRAMAYAGQREVSQYQAIPVATQTPATHPGGVIDFDRNFGGADLRLAHTRREADATLRLLAGLAVDAQREDRRGLQNFLGTALGVAGALRRDETNRSWGRDGYAQVEWEHAGVAAFGGVRASRIRFVSDDHYVVPGNPDDSGSQRFAATTPVVGAAWKPDDRTRLFASAGRGVETPTASELAYRADTRSGLNLALRPARSRNVEIGWRQQGAGGDQQRRSWQSSLVWFRADTENEITVLSNSAGRATFQNAGRTRRTGIEASFDWRFSPVLGTHLAITTLDARYREQFRTCAVTPCAIPDLAVAAGNRLPGAPQKLAFAGLQWQAAAGLSASLEWRHQGRIAVDDANSDTAAGASIVSAGWSWRTGNARQNWLIWLRGDNLTNRRGAQTVIVNEANARFFEPRPARSVLLSVQVVRQ